MSVVSRWYLLSALIALMAPHVAAGQHITSGQRVRLTLADSSARIGVVDSVNRDRIWLRSTPYPSVVALDRVQVMERSERRKPALSKGLAYGALGGAIVGGALWLAFISGDYDDGSKGLFAGVLIGSGAVGGALAGMGLSLALARDRWVVVPRDRWAARPPAWQLGFRLPLQSI
jgi:hypothetical protein